MTWICLVRYKDKERLVDKDSTQKYSFDYEATFSPLVRDCTNRLHLTLAIENNMYLYQIDVCTAYFTGDLKAEIYITQPESFIDAEHPEKFSNPEKALYALKQSRANEMLN